MRSCQFSLPDYTLRRQAIAIDILCSVDAFLVLVKVIVATLLGVQMCPKCPHCNACDSNYPCQYQFGSNMITFGGIFEGCDGFGGAVEMQRGATLHIHLIAYIISAFQHTTLERIGDMIRDKLLSVAAVERYEEWVSMHEHLDQASHEKHVDDLERQWRVNYRDSSNDGLGFFPSFILNDAAATLWDGADIASSCAEAAAYMKQYRKSCQYVLSHINHHIHPKDSKTGERVPLNACISKGSKKKMQAWSSLD